MLTIYYSPHATSTDNEAGRASGHADVPLSALGVQQARELGQHYASIALDAVFCSDLRRAADTGALAFSARGLPILLDARLREFDFGDMTQWPHEQIAEEYSRRIAEPFPGGESVLVAVERVGAFLRDVWPAYAGKAVVVIGHRATRWGLDYWSGDLPLEAIVRAPWEWRAIPIWRYEVDGHTLERHA